MSDDSPQQIPAETRPREAAAIPVTAGKPRKSGPGVFFPLLTLISLAASGGLGYLFLQQSMLVAELQATVAGMQTGGGGVGSGELAALQNAQRQFETSLRDTLQQSQQQLETSLRGELQQSHQQLEMTLDDTLQQSQQRLETSLREDLQRSLELSLREDLQQSFATSLRNDQQESRQQLESTLRTNLRQALDQEVGDLEQQLASVNARLQAQATQLEAMGRELVSTNQRIRQTSAASDQDWLLAEAEALLRLAQQYLIVNDVSTAIELFSATEERLQNSSSPGVFAVREVLGRELASLQALPELDLQGIYQQLGAYSEQVDTLVVDSGNGEDFRLPPRERAITDGWLADAMDALGQYFVVTKREEAVLPQMTAEQEYLIRRSVQLQIQQARLALLQGQADIYRSALDAAVTAISTRMQEQDGQREALVSALTALRDTPVTLTIPPLTNALEALQQVQASTSSVAAPAEATQ